MGLQVGDEVDVEVGPVAHGGHCVARHDGRVLFVRHTIPGERVTARITEGGDGDRYLRADAVVVLEASPHRVEPRCPVAGPGGCGGCDLQHVTLEHQRELKAAVVAEQLSRLGGVDREVVVEGLRDDAGLGYRTRVELAVDEEGTLGLRRHRSHDVVEVHRCPIGTERVNAAIDEVWADLGGPDADPDALVALAALDVVSASGEEDSVVVEVPRDRRAGVAEISVTELVPPSSQGSSARPMTVDARGFWQVHADAPRAFVGAVLDAAQVRPGERVLDLYSGVGLFSVPLAQATGEEGQLLAVESDALAVGHLRDNLADLPHAVVVPGRVDDLLGVPRAARGRAGNRGARGGRRPARSALMPPSADVVVLDPPRTGAGRAVVSELAAMRPRRIVYVACDPAALGRDTAYLSESGYDLAGLRSLDAFPMTHHVECVATFDRR